MSLPQGEWNFQKQLHENHDAFVGQDRCEHGWVALSCQTKHTIYRWPPAAKNTLCENMFLSWQLSSSVRPNVVALLHHFVTLRFC